eukprot:5000527-Amphidinium_carterae.1
MVFHSDHWVLGDLTHVCASSPRVTLLQRFLILGASRAKLLVQGSAIEQSSKDAVTPSFPNGASGDCARGQFSRDRFDLCRFLPVPSLITTLPLIAFTVFQGSLIPFNPSLSKLGIRTQEGLPLLLQSSCVE